MKFIDENKISEELVNSFNEEMTLELANRLEDDNYKTPFDGLKDWHLLRALAINRPELTSDYIHLLLVFVQAQESFLHQKNLQVHHLFYFQK